MPVSRARETALKAFGSVAVVAMALTGCSTEADVDTSGDGVEISGDIDTSTTEAP